jgi:hypothetical protein
VEWDRETRTITVQGKSASQVYEVDLDALRDLRMCMDLIFHVSNFYWVDAVLVGELVKAIEKAFLDRFRVPVQVGWCAVGFLTKANWKKGKLK